LLASFRTDRDRAIAGLMLFSGLRSAEVLALAVADVDIPRGWIKVIGKGDKERRVPLDPASPGWSRPICSPGGRIPPAGRCSSWRRARTGASR
jgi:site-specific recombinase XerC